MDVTAALAHAARRGLERLDAQLLLLHALGRDANDRAWLLAHDTDTVPPQALEAFASLCARRVDGEPAAYLLGRKEFHGLLLHVDARVLVPRPDTETLVGWALDVLPADGPASCVDLGTGSGAVALAVKQARPRAEVHGVDASAGALEVARGNGQRLGLDVTWRHGNWLAGIEAMFDLVVSNPPYIAAADPHLAALKHEPLQALAAGGDGLDDIRVIVAQAFSRLRPRGWLLLEHGHEQADAVRELLSAAGFAGVASRDDLAGIARCSGGQRPKVK